MKFRPTFILVAALSLPASAAEPGAPATPKPSVIQRLLHPFGGPAKPAAPTPPPAPAVAQGPGSKDSKPKRSASPAPATPKPTLMDRLLHPFSEPATTEPPAPPVPTAPTVTSRNGSKKGASVATPAPAPPKPGIIDSLLHPFGDRPAPEPPAATGDPVRKNALKGTTTVPKPGTEPAPATPKRGVMQRMLHPFGGTPAAPQDASLKPLEMGASVEPSAPKLSEAREVRVTVTLANKGRKLAQLAFPTNQRIEVLLKDKAGRKVLQWSEDQAFFAEPTLITINPAERLEYSATVSTRDLVAGETYTVETFFPNFPELRRTIGLSPEK